MANKKNGTEIFDFLRRGIDVLVSLCEDFFFGGEAIVLISESDSKQKGIYLFTVPIIMEVKNGSLQK